MTTSFAYTGNIQTFQAEKNGIYQLEVWGAQGGNSGSSSAGYGGYATGVWIAPQNMTLYVVIGGCPANSAGGYNGGGSATQTAASTTNAYAYGGGGATHIATVTGLLSDLSAYKDTGEILIVAGAGGGRAESIGTGGAGGGYTGKPGTGTYAATGGTQTAGGTGTGNRITAAFGLGGSGALSDSISGRQFGGGGGAGWYGGAAGRYSPTSDGKQSGGAGGSGNISSQYLISYDTITKHMAVYNGSASLLDDMRTISVSVANSDAIADYTKIGHGYATITLLGYAPSGHYFLPAKKHTRRLGLIASLVTS